MMDLVDDQGEFAYAAMADLDWLLDVPPDRMHEALGRGFDSLGPEGQKSVAHEFLDHKDAVMWSYWRFGPGDDELDEIIDKDPQDQQNQQDQPDPQSGGGAPSVSDIDFRLYNLMELADSLQDFCNDSNDPSFERWSKLVYESLKSPELPTITRNGKLVEMSLSDVANKWQFVKDMCSNEYLHFESGIVKNDRLHGHNFSQGTFRFVRKSEAGASNAPEVAPLVDVEAEYKKPHNLRVACKDCTNVDVWTTPGSDIEPKKVMYRQLAKAARTIRNRFGTEFDIIVDASVRYTRDVEERGVDALTKFVVVQRAAYDVFRKRLLITRDLIHPGCVEVSEARIKAFNGEMRDVKWTAVSCDASLMDAGPNDDAPSVPKKTGPVFHDESAFQVSLHGIGIEEEFPDLLEYFGRLRTKGVSAKIYKYSICRRGQTDPEVVRTVVDDRDPTDGMRRMTFSKGKMADKIEDDPANCAKYLALKRAGDWGMVKFCKKYDAVFVTADVIAALYATMIGARFIFVTNHGSSRRASIMGGQPIELMQYSMAICGGVIRKRKMVGAGEKLDPMGKKYQMTRPEVRQALNFVNRPQPEGLWVQGNGAQRGVVPMAQPKTGGGKATFRNNELVTQIALAGVVVAAAFFKSM
jgi:hypothetical protein